MRFRPTPALLFCVLCAALWSAYPVAGRTCDNVVSAVAKGVAGASCDSVKADCGILFASKAVSAFNSSLDLRDCCKAVMVGCRDEAKTIPCEVSGDTYGSCTPDEFRRMYLDLVRMDCKDTVCLDNACKGELSTSSDDDDDDDDDDDRGHDDDHHHHHHHDDDDDHSDDVDDDGGDFVCT
eukprot:evm.model.scf_1361.1 EVM.evm.TU.scf_1361.1   scf_1361:2477-3016(+)